MKLLLLSLGLFFLTLSSQAAYENVLVFTGVMDGKMPITLVIVIDSDACNGSTVLSGSYTFDNKFKWLLLDMELNDEGQIAMIEVGFTGLMIVTWEGKNLIGTWHSPDGKRSLSVKLRQTEVSQEQLESYYDEYDELMFLHNDC